MSKSQDIDGKVQHVQVAGPFSGKYGSDYWVIIYTVGGKRYSTISEHKIPQASEGDVVQITFQSVPHKGKVQDRILQLDVLERASLHPQELSLRMQEIRLRAIEAAVTLLASGGVQREQSLVAQCEALADQFLEYCRRVPTIRTHID